MGTVERMFVAEQGGQPMRPVDEARAVAGRGLDGDRYATRRGYWTDVDECQVTLIAAEDLDAITGVAVDGGQHRRNIVTRGVDLRGLAGRAFRVGEATLAYDRPRPPCRYIEGLTEPGMTRALAARRGGICARVVESGVIRPGDEIEVLPADAAATPARAGPIHRAPNR